MKLIGFFGVISDYANYAAQILSALGSTADNTICI